LIVHTTRIPYSQGQTITIKPIFDVHRGNRYCDDKAFRKYLADSDESTYFLGGGDLMDSIVIQDPRYEKSSDGTLSDAIIDEQVDIFYNDLKPYKERIIGLGRGNHEGQVIKRHGTDMVGRLCKRLETTYLGFSCLIRLILYHRTGGRVRTVIIRMHHGWGGGSRTQGGDLTKYSKDTAYWDADIFLFGHGHRKQTDKSPRLALCGNSLISKPKLIGLCGTFLKTYSDGTDSSYSEEKGYPPVEIGGIRVNLKPIDKGIKYWMEDD
jgi:hypothetical protein